MPLEGHWRRLETPLSRRDKRVLAAIACVAALATGGGIYAYVDRAPGRSDAGCVTVVIPSTLGGSTIRRCGAAARTFCRTEAGNNPEVAAQCRRKGYAVAQTGASG